LGKEFGKQQLINLFISSLEISGGFALGRFTKNYFSKRLQNWYNNFA
jgi:hypothetical protein